MNNGIAMRLTSAILPLIIVVGLFSGCASTGDNKGTSSGEYDVFLENDKGEAVRPPLADKKAALTASEAHEKAQSAMSNGDMDSALFFYVKALETDNKDEKALLGIAKVHSQRGNYDLVTLAYRMLLGINPESVTALEGLGLELVRKGERNEAKHWLLRTVALDPMRPRTFSGLGILSDMEKDFLAASSYYSYALELEPDSPKLLSNFGYSRFLAGDWTEAERLYHLALDKDAEFAQARLNLGLLFARKGDLAQAQSEFERVLTKPQSYNELGFILMTEKNYEQAEQLFQKAISSSPTFFLQANENLERVRALRATQEKTQAATEKAPISTGKTVTPAPASNKGNTSSESK